MLEIELNLNILQLFFLRMYHINLSYHIKINAEKNSYCYLAENVMQNIYSVKKL